MSEFPDCMWKNAEYNFEICYKTLWEDEIEINIKIYLVLRDY